MTDRADILSELQAVARLNGDTYSSAEVLGMVGRAAAEIEQLRAALREIAELAHYPDQTIALRALEQSARRAALDELVEHDQKLGLYDRVDGQQAQPTKEGK